MAAVQADTAALTSLESDLTALLSSARLTAGAANQTVRETVELARAAGLTWEQIAAALGITRQAASQRYGRQ